VNGFGGCGTSKKKSKVKTRTLKTEGCGTPVVPSGLGPATAHPPYSPIRYLLPGGANLL
jgi:hypothetical protein